jgi:hypothetical protein
MDREELIDYTIWVVKEIKHSDTPAYLVDRYLSERGKKKVERKEPGGKPHCPNCRTSAFVGLTGFHTWMCDKCGSEWQPE